MVLKVSRADSAVPIDISGFHLVLPALGAANICQMAVDLVINSILAVDPAAAVRYATVQTAQVQPVAGRPAFDAWSSTSAFTTCLELWAVPSARLLFLQQRAPAVVGAHELLVQEIFDWCVSAGIGRVFVLAGTDASMRGDAHLDTRVPFISVAADAAGNVVEDAALARMRIPSVRGAAEPSATAAPADAPAAAATEPPAGWRPPCAMACKHTAALLGDFALTGYAPVYFRRWLHEGLTHGAAPPITVLLGFVAEGDNRVEAAGLAEVAARACGLEALLLKLSGAASAAADAGADAPAPRKLQFVEPSYFDKLATGPPVNQFLYG